MRLLTRSDFDGLACGAILKSLGIIDNWLFVHPKDMQDGKVAVTDQDVLANVPYVPGCGMWFDHHSSEMARVGQNGLTAGESRIELSAARVIYEYYGGKAKMPHFESMVKAVDKVDSGQLFADEILHPTGWVLLGFLMDPRTGLGRFREFSISNYDLMVKLLDCCAVMSVEEILQMPDVVERVKLYNTQSEQFIIMLKARTKIYGNVIVSDLRGQPEIFAGNRFVIYSLFPEANVSVWVVDGRGKQNCPIAVGYSVLNRTCTANIGELMLEFGGGGHPMVGTCQIDYDEADAAIEKIVDRLMEAKYKKG